MRNPVEKRDENAVELESQFILRMPPEPARIVRELIRSGVTNFKDRVLIRLENDVRHGEVRVDHYLLHAKVVDLPTIIESLKTIDSKSFYKTADICQMMICKEEEDQTTTDDEAPSKTKKKDPNKVDKKFLWMHGITPPLKNVRRRRFRKTLKKKFVEQPEIEKEVKRLLRIDNDAVSVKWEIIIDEEGEKQSGNHGAIASSSTYDDYSLLKKEKPNYDERTEVVKEDSELLAGNTTNVDVEQEIFGSAVSDSEDENINVMDIDESSRISGDDSRLYDSDSQGRGSSVPPPIGQLVTEFSKEMFSTVDNLRHQLKSDELDIKHEPIGANSQFDFDIYKKDSEEGGESSVKMETNSSEFRGLTREQIVIRISELQTQLKDLRVQQQQQETELASIENQALRQRFQEINDRLLQEMYEKQNDIQTLQTML